jgi:23S rRNA (cytosine1962-C5)-methyltransferase
MVNERAAARIRGGNPWVYAPDVVRAPDGDADVVRVADAAGRFLGTAMYAADATLPVRMLSRAEVSLDRALIESRLRAAIARRRAIMPDADGLRVVHGESDALPGLIVDRYGDVVTLQSNARAIAAREGEIAAVCRDVLGARLVVARNDGSARDFEGLPRQKGILLGGGSTMAAYHDSGNRFEIDVMEDGKTGAFLDQRENHARAAEYATGDALDAFTYHGGFALALARGGARTVLALDEAAPSIERARRNAAANGLSQVTVEEGDAFDRLRALEAEGRRFDVVVIDPPALAKRKSALKGGRSPRHTLASGATKGAERAYRELNLRAFRLARPNGLVITCSCSGKLIPSHFGEIIEAAARDAGRSAQILERRGAGRDHPPLLGVPESEYLKCWFLRLLD